MNRRPFNLALVLTGLAIFACLIGIYLTSAH